MYGASTIADRGGSGFFPHPPSASIAMAMVTAAERPRSLEATSGSSFAPPSLASFGVGQQPGAWWMPPVRRAMPWSSSASSSVRVAARRAASCVSGVVA